MFHKIRERLNEKGSLPAIMGAMILIAATGLLLASYAIAGVKSSEIRVASNKLASAVSSCETLLQQVVQKTPSTNPVPTSDLVAQTSKCDWSKYGGATVTLVTTAPNAPKSYTPAGAPRPTLVVLFLTATTPEGQTLTQKKYLPYAPDTGVTPSSTSYVTGFDSNGKALWAG